MMSEHGGKTYRPWEPERYQQGSYSPAAKLSEGDLVFFLLETVPRLDLSCFYALYEVSMPSMRRKREALRPTIRP